MWTTLAGNGDKGPFFLQTKDPRISALNVFADADDAYVSYVPIVKSPTTKKNIRPGTRFPLSLFSVLIL